ncbi:MAG TPA: nuclear transport factor 2 family protein [Gemmatimonadota bacterium]|nr:nuclear transport factor 2 family protein [Gemmatimonadota bacterium]
MRAIMLMSAAALVLGCGRGDNGPDPAEAIAEAQSDPVSVTEDVEALRATAQRALVAFRAGDAATFDALYTDDAILVNPGAEPLEGRPAIDALHREEMSRAGYVVDWESIRVEAAESGDIGYDFGRWSARSESDPEASDHGYYVNVYRKVDGVWRTVVEVNGSSAQGSP